ncbi:replication initiation and membrane attachment family protein [Bacillus kwashiorkori]|uniref:replication initiation and membrane attachment family protein n=1 Tax=Bacillus kwashiorkori TaxID=1522318 RepID=UPI0007862CEB|nr:DnaD domain protein [Bacillus kwashiorkori]
MELHWKELIPGDQYVVSVDGPFNEGDRKVLTLLYQPLIGPLCISLYMTLKNQLEENRLLSEPVSHYFLMNILDENLKNIYYARLKLEAIGLLETFVKTEDETRSFLYKLNVPLSASQFFSDGLLNIYLYQKIGRDYYNRLRHSFIDKPINLTEYEKTTKAFHEIFHSANPLAVMKNADIEIENPNTIIQSRGEPAPIIIEQDLFDFDLLFAGINEQIVPLNAFTPQVKHVITTLSFLYGIDPIQMKHLVIEARTEQHTIDIEKLRKAARDWYSIEHYNKLPQLVDRIQSPVYHSAIDQPRTQEERLIRYLETVSPRKLLEDLSDGSEPSTSDIRLIEEVMLKQKLTPGVTNVLIQYCLLRTDMKLQKTYVEKIASHWSRKKIKTVPEAMELAKNEHRQYIEWQQTKKEKKQPVTRKPIRTEKVPSWFDNKETTETPIDIEKFEEEKRKMEERLKKYK